MKLGCKIHHLVLWVFLIGFCANLNAQNSSATVAGSVTDSAGAVLPGATITLVSVNTGVVSTGTTNNSGLYRISNLLPGVYRATVTRDGFKSVVKDGIELHVEDEVSINYSLVVGSVNESVTVEAGEPQLENQAPTVSQVIEGRQVEDTPLNGRNVMNLVALTPGVVPQGATAGAPTQNQLGGFFTNSFGWNNYQVGGGLAGQSAVYLDGAPLNILYGNTSSLVPTQDAIQEFRVESSVVNAQYGMFGGGVISFATKSGTNRIHGSAYEYLRNTVLDANNFFNNGTNVPRSKLIQNQFGAEGGGPIRRDLAFFFISYEGFRLAQGIPNAGRIPTPAELSGNFTADPPIYDPSTGSQFSCNGTLNVICPDRIDPTANYMGNGLKYWPAPNANSAGINFSEDGTSGSANDQVNLRIDATLTPKQTVFGRYTYWNANQQPTRFFSDTTGPSSGPSVKNKTQLIVLGDTYTPSPSTVANVRLSYLRYVTSVTPVVTNADLSAFGPFYAAIENQVTYREYPNVAVASTIGQPFSFLNVTNGSPFNNYVVSGSVTKVIGRHSLTFGGEFRRMEEYFNQTTGPTGIFNFAGVFTGCAATCTTPTGAPSAPTPPGSGATPIADFLLGKIASSAGFTEIYFPADVSNYGGVYAGDTYQIRPKLTLTYAVRWEMPGGFLEKHDRNTVLLPNQSNPLQLVNSSTYHSRSDMTPHRDLFSPRLGVVYQFAPATIVRAGYSLAFLPQFTDYGAGPGSSPINAATTFVGSGAQLSSPLGGSTTLLQPVGRSYDGSQYLGQTISSRIPSEPFPYMQQWNMNVQQVLNRATTVQLGYLGSRGVHLPLTYTLDINQLPDEYVGLPASELSQSLRPYPQYQTVNANSPFLGDSYYNSLQATLTKRFSSGGTLLANYTWAKFIGNAEATTSFVESYSTGAIQDNNNLGAERSLLSFDTPQRLVISYVLDLPVGRGKRFLSSASGVVDKIISGWNASGITTFASGFPLAISATPNILANVYGAGTIRPNVVNGCAKAVTGPIVTKVQQGQPFINQACFTQPGDTSFGDEPRVDAFLRAQGTDNWDVAVGKTTNLHDRVSLSFRAETFNIANRVQFGPPNTSSGGALFGLITSQVNQPRVMQFSLRASF
jgi:hypothetical protein